MHPCLQLTVCINMVDFSAKKRKFQKNIIKKEIPHPPFLKLLQVHHDSSLIILCDILICNKFHFKYRKNK